MDGHNLPQLLDIEQVSDGWIKKYLLKYRKPDGSLYTYESTSRKSKEAYLEELNYNACLTADSLLPGTPLTQFVSKDASSNSSTSTFSSNSFYDRYEHLPYPD